MKIFVGSSTEGDKIARDVRQVLRALGHEPVGWQDPGVFMPGETIIANIVRIGHECDAAVLVASQDDRTMHRGVENWTPRDNVVYEAGYFAGRFGRDRCVLVTLGDPRLPSDLGGVITVRLSDGPDYDQNRARDMLHDDLGAWLRAASLKVPPAVELPRVASVIAGIIARLQTQERIPSHFDVIAADLLDSLAESLRSDKGINSRLIEKIAEKSLPNARGVYAIDVLGPSGWLNPTSFRYLAVQIRQYIKCNVTADGWHLKVSSRLGNAIKSATEHMKVGSATLFDNRDQLDWRVEEPALEFCRLLLWSEDELMSPIAESVIAIHEAFNVPLFFAQRAPDHDDRRVDYIYFSDQKRVIDGFYGVKENDYETQDFVNGRIPDLIKDPVGHFWALLENEQPLFAIDARKRLELKRLSKTKGKR